MKFDFPGLFEIPDEWWVAAGMDRFQAKSVAYRASSNSEWPTVIVALTEIKPPMRNHGVREFDKERMVQILSGFANDDVLPSIEVDQPSGSFSHKFRLRDGFHRFYASAAAGFSHVPVSVRPYFDITDPHA